MTQQPFAGLLLGLLSGAGKVSDFLALVLNEAVETVLLRVARDHSLDYRALLGRYKAEVVAEFSRVSDAPAGARCSETVERSGLQCRRRGVLGGRCAPHAAAHAAQLERARRLDAYRAGVPREAAAAVVMVPAAHADSMDML
jgi:hypothetical protein